MLCTRSADEIVKTTPRSATLLSAVQTLLWMPLLFWTSLVAVATRFRSQQDGCSRCSAPDRCSTRVFGSVFVLCSAAQLCRRFFGCCVLFALTLVASAGASAAHSVEDERGMAMVSSPVT